MLESRQTNVLGMSASFKDLKPPSVDLSLELGSSPH
jgi:hypothetical protein